jgi:hypothetical protein
MLFGLCTDNFSTTFVKKEYWVKNKIWCKYACKNARKDSKITI